MEVTITKTEKYNLLNVKGRLDASTSSQFEGHLLGILDEGKEVLVDFTDLKYVSSSGLRILLVAAKKLNTANQKLTIFSMQDHIKEVFDISGFTALFNIVAANPYE